MNVQEEFITIDTIPGVKRIVMPTGKSYYECHVTMVPEEGLSNVAVMMLAVLGRDTTQKLGWKFSQIEGDIALGAGLKSYATTHYNARTPVHDVLDHLHTVANKLAAIPGVKVIRRKVELVVYDDRSTKVAPGTCEGACVACHLDDYVEALRHDPQV